MYNVARNNFYTTEKNATVYTPLGVCRFLFDILSPCVPAHKGTILDPCVGRGALLYPFQTAGYNTQGIDIVDQGFPNTIVHNFITMQRSDFPKKNPALVIANPPFNIDAKTKHTIAAFAGNRPLLPEVWLHKIIDLFGHNVPIVLFAPYGLRLNQTMTSRRWQKFVSGAYPEIASIISLPKDIYQDVLFHSEVLIFNVAGLKPHYFYHSV